MKSGNGVFHPRGSISTRAAQHFSVPLRLPVVVLGKGFLISTAVVVSCLIALLALAQIHAIYRLPTALLTPGVFVAAKIGNAPCSTSHVVECPFWDVDVKATNTPPLTILWMALDCALYATVYHFLCLRDGFDWFSTCSAYLVLPRQRCFRQTVLKWRSEKLTLESLCHSAADSGSSLLSRSALSRPYLAPLEGKISSAGLYLAVPARCGSCQACPVPTAKGSKPMN
jgi:hypothetical protein